MQQRGSGTKGKSRHVATTHCLQRCGPPTLTIPVNRELSEAANRGGSGGEEPEIENVQRSVGKRREV